MVHTHTHYPTRGNKNADKLGNKLEDVTSWETRETRLREGRRTIQQKQQGGRQGGRQAGRQAGGQRRQGLGKAEEQANKGKQEGKQAWTQAGIQDERRTHHPTKGNTKGYGGRQEETRPRTAPACEMHVCSSIPTLANMFELRITSTKPSRLANFWQGAESLAPATQNGASTSKGGANIWCFQQSHV